MKLQTNMWFTAVLTAAQTFAQFSGVLPTRNWQLASFGTQLAIEAALKLKAYFSNPDGTPAAAAYTAPPK